MPSLSKHSGDIADEKASAHEVEKMHQVDTHVSLNILGLEPQMKRRIGGFAILCVGYNICNSWVGLAATMVIGLESGGTVPVVYGMIVILFAMGCTAATMAELSSVYPTAGGPYHWTSIMAPKQLNRPLSYACAALNIFGWLAICASVTVQIGQFISGMRLFYNPDLEIPQWQNFLYYQATNLVILSYNIFGLRRTSWIHDVGFAFSLSTLVIVFITCLSRAESYSSASFVWGTFDTPEGAWQSRFVVFTTAMANPNFMYAGIDGAIHLAEECSNASRAIPRALFSTIVVGFCTAFPFAVAMLYCLQDFDAVTESVTGVPIYEIWHQATRSGTAATVFLTMLLVIALFALNACQEVTSRLTWSFARDNAILGSKLLDRVHPRLQVPVWALLANAFVVLIIGCVYVGSTTAFNAFVGSCLLLQQNSFAIPAALLLWHGRSSRVLPPGRSVRLGAFGWVANVVTVVFALLITVMYCFPIEFPITGSNMNYTAAVIGIMTLFAVINWFAHAGRSFRGPRLPDESQNID